MIVKDLDTLGYRKVVFRCDNELSFLALLRAVKLAWTGCVQIQRCLFGREAQGNLLRLQKGVNVDQ